MRVGLWTVSVPVQITLELLTGIARNPIRTFKYNPRRLGWRIPYESQAGCNHRYTGDFFVFRSGYVSTPSYLSCLHLLSLLHHCASNILSAFANFNYFSLINFNASFLLDRQRSERYERPSYILYSLGRRKRPRAH